MKNLILILLAATLSACSISSGDHDQTKQYTDDRENLLQSYSSILGSYAGPMKVQKVSQGNDNTEVMKSVSIPLELGVYTEDVPSGKDADGKTKLIPNLKVRYRQKDAAREDQILEGRFINETGELNAATANGSVTVRAILKADTLTGEVIKNGGRMGVFSLTLKSRDVVAPYSDAASDLYDRQAAQYKAIAGLYNGVVTPPAATGTVAPFPVQIQMSFVPVTDTKTGLLIAKMKASYKRPDFTDPSMSERLLDVIYRLDTDPAQLIMNSDGGNSQIPNAYFMSINGNMERTSEGLTFTGEFYDRRGFVGVLKMTKQQ